MLKQLIAPVVVSGALLAGGVATAGVAGAATPAATATTHHATGRHATRGEIRAWLKAHRKEIRRDVVTTSATAIGITPATLVTDLRAGHSIAQVAAANGSSAQAVDTALVSAADGVVSRAVLDHQLTAAQGQWIDARLPVWAGKVVDKVR